MVQIANTTKSFASQNTSEESYTTTCATMALDASGQIEPNLSHDKFKQFPKLPLELQLKIWEMATCYNTAQVHTVVAKPSSLAQIARASPKSQPPWEERYHREDLPLGYHELARPDSYYAALHRLQGPRAEIFKSSRKIDSAVHACSIARRHILKTFRLTFAFGTYLNLSHDFIFLNAGADGTDISPVVYGLSSAVQTYQNLAVEEDVYHFVQYASDEGMFDILDGLVIITNVYRGLEWETGNFALVDYSRFYGRKSVDVYDEGHGSMPRRQMVAVP